MGNLSSRARRGQQKGKTVTAKAASKTLTRPATPPGIPKVGERTGCVASLSLISSSDTGRKSPAVDAHVEALRISGQTAVTLTVEVDHAPLRSLPDAHAVVAEHERDVVHLHRQHVVFELPQPKATVSTGPKRISCRPSSSSHCFLFVGLRSICNSATILARSCGGSVARR